MREIKVCIFQVQVSPNEIFKNTKKCCSLIEKVCRETHPEIIVFPETVSTGFSPGKDIKKFCQNITKNFKFSLNLVQQVANKEKVYIFWPSYEPAKNKEKVYNTVFLISSEGKIVGKYRKIHPFPTEFWTIPGEKPQIFDLYSVKIGVMICYDGDFPELARYYAVKGVEIILRPSAFLRDYEIWSLTNRARAYDNQVYVIAVNSIGTDAEEKSYFGHSMIVDPYARIITQLGCNENFSVVNLLSKEKINKKSVVEINHLKDRKLNFLV